MKALIIDDTRLARQELKHLLKDLPDVQVVGEAAEAEEAIEKIGELQPDLLFLDIQMPGKDGFALLEELEDAPEVIFTTAYDQYALKAFEVNALDYLTKPITQDRLSGAIEKVKERLETRADLTQARKVLTEKHQVFVKEGDYAWFVPLYKVRVFEVVGSYSRLYFEDQQPMIHKSLNYLEGKLDPEVFFRANRQQIVNLNWVERVEPWFSGTIKLYLKGGEEVEVSRRQSIRFREHMSF
ncbi:MAG TPA: DNA-binding response regulator [Cytophagales bacterium]|nr:DNA-binding response regulator [Cytophagales bacterium]HAA18111.1 DNA-binding response regulator [Cytophagales bacterium]HAP61889.1 DNA-binding response regulator [Cytophagales bacterium]